MERTLPPSIFNRPALTEPRSPRGWRHQDAATSISAGWAGWRAATRDHLPLIGAVPDRPGLWLACAYGSRGLSWSALAGDLIGAWMDGEPVPAERELIRRIGLR